MCAYVNRIEKRGLQTYNTIDAPFGIGVEKRAISTIKSDRIFLWIAISSVDTELFLVLRVFRKWSILLGGRTP